MTPAAEKQRRRRARARAGKIWLGIEADEIDLVEALVQIGLLHPWQSEDRAAIAKATERTGAWNKTSAALSFPKHAYRQWLDGEFNVWAVMRDTATWGRFWFDEVREDRMPRFWLRWAFQYMQMFLKVTAGTPGDAQLGTYLPEADFVVSADRNFIRMTDMLRPYSPCRVALTKLVKGDAEGVDEVIAFLKSFRSSGVR